MTSKYLAWIPFGLTLIFWLLVGVAAMVSEEASFRTAHLSEVKQSEAAIWGILAFVALILSLLWIAGSFFRWRIVSFALFYSIAAVAAFGLLVTDAYSGFHILLYMALVASLILSYLCHLVVSSYFIEYFVFVGMCLFSMFIMGFEGSALGQKALIVSFQVSYLYQHRYHFMRLG